MNKAAELHANYLKALALLQASCLHESLSEYLGESWAPGHMTGRDVQVCEDCNKVVHSRTVCWNCLGYIYDDGGYKAGDGDGLAHGGCWCCQECALEANKRGKDAGYASHLSRNEHCRQCKKVYPRDGVTRKGYAGLCSDECAETYTKK